MQVQEAFIKLRQELAALYDERESEQIAHWVIENLTGYSRSARILHKTDQLTPAQESAFTQYIRELLQWRPVQYVLGEAWFSGMKFFVDERVLVPRPETEELVDWVAGSRESGVGSLESGVGSQQPFKILDIGTGSGCIPIAIKKKSVAWDVWTVDISADALAVAALNAKDLGAEIHFARVDILDEKSRAGLPVFDIIVSNPPYIPLKDKTEMSENVLLHEPHLALFVANDDPLIFYREIIHFAVEHLHSGGLIFFEVHERLSGLVQSLLAAADYHQIQTKKDMQGKDRMISAVKS
jgi:release factor glutamine methyltransferase